MSRKTTSVLFGDLVGFTPLSATRDVEDVRDLLSGYFQTCRTVIARYGGTVEKFIGDAVMAVWGVPAVHEDDAERAVRAGLELTAAVAALGEELALSGLAMRVGIVTGEVAVTEGATGEGMVAGDAVNTAARIQSVAAPGRVWVDPATRDRAAAAIAFADAGAHTLKGKDTPLRLFQARSVTAAVGGARREDGLTAPLTGRARELSVLTELFHATVESQSPRLLVVTGTAGVGKSRLGRELEFYLDGLADPVWWHRGRCPAYGDATAFWALTEAFRTRLEIAADADAATVDTRLAAGLDRHVHDPETRSWLGPRLAILLGGSQAITDVPREELFGAWTAFLQQLSAAGHGGEAGGQLEPVVLLVEDAEHADDGLLDFLDLAVDQGRFPLFVIVLARPELLDRRPGLGSGPRRSSLHLEPLPDRQMRLLVDSLVAELSETARRRLLDRAEGIPLFAVETVRWLIDRDAVLPVEGRYVAEARAEEVLTDPAAPGSVEAVVAARLDGLDPALRDLLTDAAVLGLEFDLDGLTALGHGNSSAAAGITALARRDLLRPSHRDRRRGDAGFTFTQAVVRSVAYNTLSRKDRRARHLAVADHLATRPDPARELVGVIAQHLFDAAACSTHPDNPVLVDRAVDLLRQGARRALDLGAPTEALTLVERGLGAIVAEDGSPAAAELHDLAAEAHIQRGDLDRAGDSTHSAAEGHRSAGRVLAAARSAAAHARALNQHGRSQEALQVIAPWWRLVDARRREGPPSDELEATRLMVLVRVAGALVWPFVSREGCEDLPEPSSAILEAVALAERLQDPADLAHALNILSIHFALGGAPDMSVLLSERAARAVQEAGRPAEEMFTLCNLCATLFPRDLRRAAEVGDRTLALGRQVPIAPRLDMAAGIRATLCWLEGNWVPALELVERIQGTHPWAAASGPAIRAVIAASTGRRVTEPATPADEVDNPGLRAWLVTAEEITRPQPDVARLAGAVQVATAAEGLNEDTWILWPIAVDAALEAAAGRGSAAGSDALPVVQELLAMVEDAPRYDLTPLGRAQLLRLRGSLALIRGDDLPSAETDLRAAVTALDDFGTPFYAARARLSLGQVLLLRDDRDEARERLSEAADEFARLEAAPWEERARRLLPERSRLAARSVG